MRCTLIFLASVLAAGACAEPARAQRTWVVDSHNRPGTNFRDLPPAFVAAAPGDTVLVRDGTYTPSKTNKGIRLFGVSNVRFSFSLRPETLIVQGVPKGQTFEMKGFGIEDPLGRTVLLLADNQGRVHVEGVQLGHLGTIYSPLLRPTVVIRNCRQVSITGSAFKGRPGCMCDRSAVAITSCDFLGGDSGQLQQRTWWGQPGLVGLASTLHIARSSGKGGAGVSTYAGERPASPALGLRDCKTEISGDSASLFEAGNIATTAKAAIEAFGGSLRIDPNVRLVPKGTATRIWGTAKVTSTSLPSLTVRGAPPGGTVRADLFAPRGWRQVLALSLPADRVVLPIGNLWIDPNLFLVVDSGVMGAAEHRVTQLPVPNIGALLGLPIAIQAIAGGTKVPVLSNPVVVVLY